MSLTFVVADRDGQDAIEIPARDRRVTWRLDDPCDASFTLSGRDPAAGEVVELGSDLLVYRDGSLVFRGRVGPSSDEIDTEAHKCQFSAVDYRGVLDRRIALAALTWTGIDQSTIGWELVEHAQDEGTYAGSDLGITRGVGQTTGITRDFEVPEGKKIGESIATLGRLVDGFEWAVSPLLEFDVYFPRRGTPVDFVADYGSTVSKISRAVDTSQFATLIRQSGADLTTPVIVPAADLATRPEGRWDLSLGDTDLADDATVAAAGDGALLLAERLLPTWTGTLAPGVWDPAVLNLGDSCMLVVQSGRVQEASVRDDFDTYLRVIEIAVQESDDGAETVAVTWGRPPLPKFPERDLAARITKLERR